MSGAVKRIEAALGAMEAAAKAATPGPWHADNWGDLRGAADLSRGGDINGPLLIGGGYEDGAFFRSQDAEHVATHDPAAVIALVDGLRKVVALHRQWQVTDEEGTFAACDTCESAEGPQPWPCLTLDALAAALDPGVGDGREMRGE